VLTPDSTRPSCVKRIAAPNSSMSRRRAPLVLAGRNSPSYLVWKALEGWLLSRRARHARTSFYADALRAAGLAPSVFGARSSRSRTVRGTPAAPAAPTSGVTLIPASEWPGVFTQACARPYDVLVAAE